MINGEVLPFPGRKRLSSWELEREGALFLGYGSLEQSLCFAELGGWGEGVGPSSSTMEPICSCHISAGFLG